MTSIMSWSERVPRNPHRARRVSGRSRKNPVESMTPQGQALWASRNVGNASGFVGPEEKPRDYKPEMFNHLRTVDEMEKLVSIILNHKG